MSTTKFTRSGTQTKTFVELICNPSFGGGLHEIFNFFSAVHILLSITAFLTNSLILVALHKESSLHRPSKLLYRSLATTDLLVGLVAQPLYATYWMSLVQEHWSLCRYAFDAAYITGYALFLVSLMTMTAISVDRLLALLLGLRYKQIVTLKRTYIIVATIWILAIVSSLCALLDDRIILLHRLITILLCLVISLASYTKIFRTLRYHQVQAEDPVQQQPSQLNVLNIAQYRKAVYSALWVQLALVVCFAPFFIVVTAIAHSNKTHSSHLVILWGIADVLVYFNSTLNPFLYCWRISEVRQAMKQTIRQALCCSWS
nr:melanocyte-stimulating hormone receptor-like [Pocillopora verrucosa]